VLVENASICPSNSATVASRCEGLFARSCGVSLWVIVKRRAGGAVGVMGNVQSARLAFATECVNISFAVR